VGKAEFTDRDREFTDRDREFTDGDREFTDGDREFTDGDREFTDGDREFTDGDREFTDGDRELTDTRCKDTLRRYHYDDDDNKALTWPHWASLFWYPFYFRWPQGTDFSQLPSAVTSTKDHPLGSPSVLF
jgi:hypothetical protein